MAYIGVNMLADMRDESRQSGRVWINDIGAGECIHLYAAPPLQSVPVPDELLSSMEEVIRISDREHEAWTRAKANIKRFRNAMLKSVTNEP